MSKIQSASKTGRILEELRCLVCGNEWFPRSVGELPAICPKCKSASWATGAKYAKDVTLTKANATLEKEIADAIERGFVYDRSNTVYNAYFRWCESHNKPFVKVRLKTKYAYVKVDMISTQKRLNIAGQEAAKALFRELPVINPQGVEMFVGPEICSVDGVTKAQSGEIAKALLELASNPSNYDEK
jgi:hypothetical protein